MIHAGARALRAFVPRGSAPTLDGLGSALKYWWEVDSSHVTLNGSNVSQLDERVAAAHATQATAGNQPAYTTAGGPNGLDCITLQDTGRRLNATISVAAANRYGVYVVSSVPSSGGRVPSECAASGATIVAIGYRNAGLTQLEGYADFTTAPQTAVVTSPAHDANFHLHAFRPLASGALYEVDGSVVTVDFTGTDTVKAYDTFRVGYGSALSAGAFWAAFIVDDSNDTNDQIIKDYVAYYTGLTLS